MGLLINKTYPNMIYHTIMYKKILPNVIPKITMQFTEFRLCPLNYYKENFVHIDNLKQKYV